ncbi:MULTISPECIES: flagellar hook assembly protein FlgD [unclassified Pseudomonas]|uniref:flagellar hook assembly protein FlgD n=1 Tax=unclassified Pseudomonas TaxID=196821 RepID=UPI002AC917F5|nr:MULTISPECIES: flagellar hook assembly protein FlgD [unclassified Pseudomonas]MEB0048241.1 flagellar hook assembly protein FlgD [Pseudomonas sp. Dout3]MEB0099182.1 flagellar hook assembly protein FlgD [Pseudomonas sp. DC1.2]WPX57560.1 flagellar hook assembly protein FlgD [Pseudomonas sp. DC1.2]
MSITDSTSSLSLTDILANSSVKKTASTTNGLAAATSSATGSQTLGKDAFLQLLVTQLKNQNPLSPQDNGAFVAQLAQFSSLEGITSLNTTVSSLAGNYNSSQALQASSLVGRSVIAQTSTAQVDDPTKGLTGSVSLSSSIASGAGTVTVTDASGKVIRSIDLGSQPAGSASFKWDGKDSAGTTVPAGTYTFKANALINGTATDLATYLPATVNSVTISQTGGELMLNLAGMGSVALSKVQTIGI